MIAALVPLLWRRRDMVDALGRIGAKAIVTCARAGGVAHADIAMHTAAALFPIRHVFGFGLDLPDGVASLDDVLASGGADLSATPVRPDAAAAHVAAITFGVDARGATPMARNHIELISGGLAIVLEGGIESDARLLSTVPIGSFAGLALTLMPWLLSGATLHLHHGFEPLTFGAQRDATDFDAMTLPSPSPPCDLCFSAPCAITFGDWPHTRESHKANAMAHSAPKEQSPWQPQKSPKSISPMRWRSSITSQRSRVGKCWKT
jgi:hypothetical protein